MEVVDINIVATSTKSPANPFIRSYTQYHLKVQTRSSQYVIKKRYSEFYAFYKLIQKFIESRSEIPQFPSKTLRKLSKNVIFRRKNDLETWTKALVKQNIELDLLASFLCISQFNEPVELTPDEQIIKTFSSDILKNPNRKIAFLDKFSKDFFVRRRIINSEIAEELFEVLIPMCADANCIGKPLDIISKLLNRDFYRYYESMTRVFTGLPNVLLSKMNLKDYIKKKLCPDWQSKAYSILKILQENEKNVEEMLEFDSEALEIFNSWGVCTEKPVHKYKTEVIPLIRTKELRLDYKIQEKTIQVTGCFEAFSSVEKITDLIFCPFERKQWDLRLNNMFEDGAGYKMLYEIDNKVYEFDVFCDKVENTNSAHIKFCGNLNESELGEFCWNFEISQILSNDSHENEKVRCSWVLEYKGKATKLVMYDLIGEEALLQNSFQGLVDMSQKRNFSFYSVCKKNTINESIMRKRHSFIGK